MATTSDEVTTLLVAPAPPRVAATTPDRTPDACVAVLGLDTPPHPDAAEGTSTELRASLESVRATLLRRPAPGTYLLGTPTSPEVLDGIGWWHRRHHHLGYLDTTIVAPEGARIDPGTTGAARWTSTTALRSAPLPGVGVLLSSLSGPRQVLLAGIDAVLALPPSELASLGAYALLAGLSRTGGVVFGRHTPEPATTSVATPIDGGRLDPAERLAAYRPPAWPRQQREPGYTVVVEADGGSVAELTTTLDSVLAGSRGDIEIAVRGAGPHREQLTRRYAEEPRFRTRDALWIGPRVLLLAQGSLLTHDTLVALARHHEQHSAGLVLVTHAGDDRRACAASVEIGAWKRATALAGRSETDGLPRLEDVRAVLEPHYLTWWCNADDVGLQRPGASAAASDLLDGTSAPPRAVLAELEQQQLLLASTRAELRRVERDLDRLRGHPLVRAGLAVRRRLP